MKLLEESIPLSQFPVATLKCTATPNLQLQMTTSACTSFGNNVEVSASVIYVSCRNIFFWEVYANVHAIFNPRSVEKKRKLDPKTSFSVLLVGIDSISKAHLERVMPKTHKYLEGNENFLNMKGYTKIALNTLPNLMGILSGLEMNQVNRNCRYVDHIDECYNIWKVFRKAGYVTAYGEDAVSISSFNCCGKKGFTLPPTDFYFRPYMIAAEKLGVIERHNMNYCAGPETEGERIMNLVRDFQASFGDVPKFGLFWMNTFSHDNANMPGAMDDKVEEFLHDISKNLGRTIFIFFSDHGIRHGALRQTYSESFKRGHPKWYKSVKTNTKRLITAYDIYMTLQNILVLANKNYSVIQSLACPLCHSLFREISIHRSCKNAAIPKQWCVCNVSTYITPEEPLKTQAAQFFVGEINKLVQSYNQGYKCYSYDLAKVQFAGVSQARRLLLKVETYPNAIFEGSFEMVPELRLLGTISRLDRYAPHSRCIRGSSLEMYCYCKQSIFSLIKTKFCSYLYLTC